MSLPYHLATSPAGSLPFSEAVIEVALQQQEQANEAEKTRHIQTQIKIIHTQTDNTFLVFSDVNLDNIIILWNIETITCF